MRLFLSLILFFCVALAKAEASQFELNQAYLHYCQGQNQEADEILDSLLERDSQSYFAFSLRELFLPDRMASYAEKIQSRFPEPSQPELHSERLTLARVLMHYEDPNIERIRGLLDFHSQNKEIESLRLSTVANLNEATQSEMSRDDVLRLQEEAFLTYGEIEPGFLHPLVVVGSDSDFARQLKHKYRPLVEDLSDGDPWRDYLFLEMALVDEEISFLEALGPMMDIRDRCPVDIQFRYSFGIIASFADHPHLAYDEFSSIASIVRPWSGLYFYWGTTATRLGLFQEAREHFRRAEESGPWLRKTYKEAMEEWVPFLDEMLKRQQTRNWYTVFGLLGLLVFAGLTFWILRSIYKKMSKLNDPSGAS